MKTRQQKYLLPLTLLLVGISPLTACATPSGTPVEGRVIEEGTNKPVPNAIVVARWTEAITLVFDSRTRCVHVESAVTDNEGRFTLPRYKDRTPNHLDAYKPGYERSEQYYKTQAYREYTDILKPSTQSRGERLGYLERIEYATRCPGAKESGRNMLPFVRALYEEAKSLVVTKDDQKIADDFLSSIETIELGYDTAMKRAIERAEKRKQQP